MESVDLRARRVLVVDDDADTVAALLMLFDVFGCELRAEMRGRNVLRAAREFNPDLILLDIGLPDINGYEVIHALRADVRLARCFVVAITGRGTPRDIRHAMDAGFDEHLVKPADASHFRRIARLAGARAEQHGGN